ncbi:unnamed protein product [Lactuca saligna]|uniref:Uncharacterized protein n=1 Tax=Lactuca saligna TaxID=75948 RepID=A0AA35YZQ0_LACSI|nr:unnamed protein product [Lactuca saligna]
MSNVSSVHTTGIIVADTSKLEFVGSIPKAMLCDVPRASKVLKGYCTIPTSRFRPLTPKMQLIIAKADKPKIGEPLVSVNASDAGVNTLGFTMSSITPPISPLRQDDPDMIYGDGEDNLPGFTFSPFTIRIESDDQAPLMKGKLKDIHEKLDSFL